MNVVFKVLFIATFVARVSAWGAAGHEIIAIIAQMHLHPTVLPTICSILYPPPSPQTECNMASVATWADKVRYHMHWSGPLHYVGGKDDYPPETCLFPGPKGWAGDKDVNVLGAIRNTTNILVQWIEDGRQVGDYKAQEALKFLIHFVGDLHMPLHLTGRGRGGNDFKVMWDGRITNLHSLWDSLLIAKAIRNTPSNYSRPLPDRSIEANLRGAIYDPYIRMIVWEGISSKWANEMETWADCPAEKTLKDTQLLFWEQTKQFFFGNAWKSTETDDDVVCPYHWAKPIQQLDCEFVWPKQLDEPPYGPGNLRSHKQQYLELDTPEYGRMIANEWVVERLLATAGIRLASTLNWLFRQ